ncbi:MAG: glycosyltransferase family 2 protein [Bacteroidales bacterium]|nr:glycosyltransferase family 2 protein [Bacteroidales bacterium]
MKILVIVVTYNGMKWIERCLCSVAMSRVKADCMVVDNCSTDGTPEWIEENFPEVRLVRSERNLGFGGGNNVGLQVALDENYDYVYLLNQDAWLQRDTFDKLLEAWDNSRAEGEHFGLLSPMQTTANPDRLDARFQFYYRVSKPMTPGGVKEMKFIMAAHWMISRECLQDVGGFSPAFSQYGEDDNWLNRAVYHGWRYGAVNTAFAVHDRDQRPNPKARRMRLKYIGSVVKLSNPRNCLPLSVVLEPLRLLAISIRYASWDTLKSIPGFLSKLPEYIRLRRESKKKGAFLKF